MDKESQMDPELHDVEDHEEAEATTKKPTKRRRLTELSLVEQALNALVKDFDSYRVQQARIGNPLAEDDDMVDKYNRAINAVNAYNWYKSAPRKLKTKAFVAWNKKE